MHNNYPDVENEVEDNRRSKLQNAVVDPNNLLQVQLLTGTCTRC